MKEIALDPRHPGSALVIVASLIGLAILIGYALAGCSPATAPDNTSTAATSGSPDTSNSAPLLAESQLKVYCGAGMTDPFTEIAHTFEAETGCKVDVTFANAAQIQTQIATAEEGDFFIAGSAEELDPIAQYVEESTPLVKHVPVIAVPSANPRGINGLADLADVDMLLIGDPDSTPIGKIARQALSDTGMWEALNGRNAITTTTTAPQIASALAQGQGDAGIVWKENVKSDDVEIIGGSDLDPYVKTIPAALLTFASDERASTAFQEHLDTPEVREIWEKYGYELA